MKYEFERDKSLLMAIYFLLLVFGLSFLYLSYLQLKKTDLLITKGERTMATVCDIITEKDSDDGTAYRPIFEFTDRSNTTIRVEHEAASNPAVWSKGEKVSILYDPDNSYTMKVISYWGLYISGRLCGLLLHHRL